MFSLQFSKINVILRDHEIMIRPSDKQKIEVYHRTSYQQNTVGITEQSFLSTLLLYFVDCLIVPAPACAQLDHKVTATCITAQVDSIECILLIV
mmetsp:Transcript_39845/g.95878  ORF Transcript_39845/g.95878 Transcript_39845/m.95878 type:complete len:94 (+) Transcript_39845:1287-1568(+)